MSPRKSVSSSQIPLYTLNRISSLSPASQDQNLLRCTRRTPSSRSSMGRGRPSSPPFWGSGGYSMRRSYSMTGAITTYGSTTHGWRRAPCGSCGRKVRHLKKRSVQRIGCGRCTRGRWHKFPQEARSDIGGGTFSCGCSTRCSKRPRQRYVVLDVLTVVCGPRLLMLLCMPTGL